MEIKYPDRIKYNLNISFESGVEPPNLKVYAKYVQALTYYEITYKPIRLNGEQPPSSLSFFNS